MKPLITAIPTYNFLNNETICLFYFNQDKKTQWLKLYLLSDDISSSINSPSLPGSNNCMSTSRSMSDSVEIMAVKNDINKSLTRVHYNL